MTALPVLDAEQTQARTMSGIGYALIGFSVFSLQDATVKWLVATLPVWEVLFFRSILIVILVTVVTGTGGIRRMLTSPNRKALLIRSALILTAWLTYFTAARSLQLAELVTLYFSAPIFVILLSIFVLKERVNGARWMATLVGFAGVVIAANPTTPRAWLPIALTLCAAFCWAWTNILIRMISRTETTLTLMMSSNALFIVACGVTLPFVWVTPDALSIGLLLSLGFVGAFGQYFLFEGYARAPASAVAPFEYVSLVYAFGWGFLIWHDWPPVEVFAGAALIMMSGIGLIIAESRISRRLRRA